MKHGPVKKSNFINIQHFSVYRCDAVQNRGVCIYVRETLKSSKISTTVVNNAAVEDIWVAVQSSMYPSFIIFTIYRHCLQLNHLTTSKMFLKK